jgi:Glycosyl hydrolase catalytic core
MQDVLPWLDEQNFVERYSWFGDYPDYLVNDAESAHMEIQIKTID